MASGREHMASNHQKEQGHWTEFAKGFGELSTHIRTVHKETGMNGDCKAAEACDKLSGLAQAHADYHAAQVEACMKAVDGELNKLIPHQVSSVYSHAVPVPRGGQPPLPGKPNVPLQFQKLVAVDEDEEIQLRS
jgi:hypothetical protein